MTFAASFTQVGEALSGGGVGLGSEVRCRQMLMGTRAKTEVTLGRRSEEMRKRKALVGRPPTFLCSRRLPSIYLFWEVYSFPIAVLTNDHKLCGLKQCKCVIFQF